VPITADSLSEGDETFSVNLNSPTGGALLGTPATSAVVIAKNSFLTAGSTFTDVDGDLVTLKITGPGALNYYLTNGTGPVSEIDLSGTDPAKTVVSVKVKKAAGGNGHFDVGEITGTGVRTLSLSAADLIGSGINLSSFLGSLTIGDVKNAADISLAGSPPSLGRTTAITAGVIGDGTDITITGAPLGSLTAIAVGTGTITAPSVGSIRIKGKAKTPSLPAIPGDFKSDLTIAGTGLSGHTPALKSLQVAGAVSGSTIRVGGGIGTVGDVGSVLAGSFVNSTLFAGYTGPNDGYGSYNLPSTIGPFRVTGAANAFSHSFVIAANFNNVTLSSVDPDDGGIKFGFLYHTKLKSLVVKSPSFVFNANGPAEQDMPLSDFYVKKT
jgi:hypothetical protein